MVPRKVAVRLAIAFALFAGLLGSAACEDGDPLTPEPTETADVSGQGPEGPVVAENGATLVRTPDGISFTLSMPTPEPGSYTYPTEGAAFAGPGDPEVFTLWVFVFDDPEAEDWTGAFLGGGDVVDRPNVTLGGHVSLDTQPFDGAPLSNPEGARVRLAVAPHGELDPDLMPEQLQTPTGPGPDNWWLAEFD